ncbi:mechanosensitive ion channel protein [Iodidimonas muriae]|uniref:Mechanosensitive ion channel protein n=1 Tax=Iodidimonas muriae TaxID=261467 RepID=A0ABQ2LDV4_9PROT|nr:mechanosensitive ion channel domain-containing protein [Iodidimonas muriae]GER08264.1 mechanosensitive ion channel protein [Kordiimonadales bacterium JCM 17843]GGO12630.1 mechanosensitive ion channel protein [Iodidimonas muriae]
MEQELSSFDHLRDLLDQVLIWLGSDLFAYASLAQFAVIALSLGLSWLLAGALRKLLGGVHLEVPILARIAPFFSPLTVPAFALLLIATAGVVAEEFTLPTYLFDIATSLLTAWLVIRFAVNFIRSQALRRLVASVAWLIAALNIVGLLDPITRTLGAARFSVGDVSISLLSIINGLLAFFLLIWLALAASRLLENRVDALSDVNPSARELVKKLARIALVILAVMIAFNATGVDLTALAVFSGALGVGLGFGLQKVVANFVSGVILLMDRSIKPGDVIETQGTYGWINHLGARYTSIITRDGTEFLVPNEDMITQSVINWSFSDRRVRRKIPISVSYECDLRKAMSLMEEAAHDIHRVLKSPPPAARLMGFGDNGVDLELRLWIEDPQSGVVNVASEVMLAIWDAFHKEGIDFPFPQRVVHFANATPPKESVAPSNEEQDPGSDAGKKS